MIDKKKLESIIFGATHIAQTITETQGVSGESIAAVLVAKTLEDESAADVRDTLVQIEKEFVEK